MTPHSPPASFTISPTYCNQTPAAARIAMGSESHTLEEAVRKARLDFVFRGQTSSLASSIVLAAITVAVLSSVFSRTSLALWFASFVAITLGRIMVARRYQRRSDDADLKRWRRALLVGAVATALCWATLCLTLYPQDLTLQLFLAFVLAGNAAGAVTSLGAERRAAAAFVFISIVPLACRLLIDGSSTRLAMGAMVVLFLVMVSGSLQRLHVQIVDMVSARLDANEHLRALQSAQATVQALNQRLTVATDAAKVGIFEWDLERNALDWNLQNNEIFRIEPDGDTSPEQAWRLRIHETCIERFDTGLRSSIASGDEIDLDYRILRPDGSERDIKTRGIIQRNAAGLATRIIGVNWDVTEIRRVDRMKSEFVSIVSHELRTPLTSVRAALALLASGKGGVLSEKGLDLMALASRNADRLSVLINDILDIERIESGRLRFEFVRRPLLPTVEHSIEANAALADTANIGLQLIRTTDAMACIDIDRLLQVMTNLLSNAIKFSSRGGVVEIAIDSDDATVKVSVRDRGPGIAPALHDRLFKKFSQGDSSDTRAKGGSGLGLAITKAIIEQMGGSVGFTSMSDGGTTFFFELPRIHADATLDDQRTTVVLPLTLGNS